MKTTNEFHTLAERAALKSGPQLNLTNLQSLMWDKVGIIRSGKNLAKATDILLSWYISLPNSTDRSSYELTNMVLNARLITEAALLREESRGAHFRTDFPKSSPDWQKHIVFKNTSFPKS